MSGVRTAVVTGASSGVGSATALALAALGIDLALVARREDRLRDVSASIATTECRVIPVPADLAEAPGARRAMERAAAALGSIDALILCHGTNIPARRLVDMSVADWDTVVATNLSSVLYCLHAVLPDMRSQGHGLIVAISSIAGLHPSALSGAAYSAAKAGLNALCACINLEEGPAGIRACVIAPGDIDTELLDRRPEPPPPEARRRMLRPADVAGLVADVVRRPERVLVDEIVVRPSGL